MANKKYETMVDIPHVDYYKGVRELVGDIDTKPPPLKYAVASNLTEEQAQIVADISKKYKCTVSAAIRYIITTFDELCEDDELCEEKTGENKQRRNDE